MPLYHGMQYFREDERDIIGQNFQFPRAPSGIMTSGTVCSVAA